MLGRLTATPCSPSSPLGYSPQPHRIVIAVLAGEACTGRPSFQRELAPTEAHRRPATHHSPLRLLEHWAHLALRISVLTDSEQRTAKLRRFFVSIARENLS